MLTRREYEQLKIAVQAMNIYNINGDFHVSQNNVLAILQRFADLGQEYGEEGLTDGSDS